VEGENGPSLTDHVPVILEDVEDRRPLGPRVLGKTDIASEAVVEKLVCHHGGGR
jgi:hypothetical protein